MALSPDPVVALGPFDRRYGHKRGKGLAGNQDYGYSCCTRRLNNIMLLGLQSTSRAGVCFVWAAALAWERRTSRLYPPHR